MTAFYNEWESYPAQWTRNLIQAGHVAPGVVDERSIADLVAEDVRGYTQAHFFSGIAVWSHALRLAGWPDDQPIWTFSCPCQPFSKAGKGKGFEDDRHLWPEMFRLIKECRPDCVIGEQVASPDGLKWLDLVSTDLEGEGYAFGAVDTCAAGIGAPHLRQRLFFVAHTEGFRWRSRGTGKESSGGEQIQSGGLGEVGYVADTNGFSGDEGSALSRGGNHRGDAQGGGRSRSGSFIGELADADRQRRNGEQVQQGRERQRLLEVAGGGGARELGNSVGFGGRRNTRAVSGEEDEVGFADGNFSDELVSASEVGDLGHTGIQRLEGRGAGVRNESGDAAGSSSEDKAGGAGPLGGFWEDAEWLYCRDGKFRATKPGIHPLAHGAVDRMGRIKATGNAIVPQVAATFIRAFIDCTQHL